MMPVIVRLWVASDTLLGVALIGGMVWSLWRVRVLRLASCRCWASWVGMCMPVCLGLSLGQSVCRVEGGGAGRAPRCCSGGGPLRLYGVSLVMSAMGDELVLGCQLIHLCGVGGGGGLR